jgi:hypothetical protein
VTSASRMLAAGPANPVLAMPLRISPRKRVGFTGTGLAQPKPAEHHQVPKDRDGQYGLSVILPRTAAVSSPSL